MTEQLLHCLSIWFNNSGQTEHREQLKTLKENVSRSAEHSKELQHLPKPRWVSDDLESLEHDSKTDMAAPWVWAEESWVKLEPGLELFGLRTKRRDNQRSEGDISNGSLSCLSSPNATQHCGSGCPAQQWQAGPPFLDLCREDGFPRKESIANPRL